MKADTESSQAEKERIPRDEDVALISLLSFYIGGYGGPSYRKFDGAVIALYS